MTPDRFLTWFRDAHDRSGLSLRQLAARAGVDHSTVSRIRKGDREPSLSVAASLAAALGAYWPEVMTPPVQYVNRGDMHGSGVVRRAGYR